MINKGDDFAKVMRVLVRALDNLIHYQEYMHPAAKKCSVDRGSIGIGLTNLAYWMAKRGITYSDPDLEAIHELAEAYGYWYMKATIDLAKERGPCTRYSDSIYSTGKMMIDTYNKNVDDLTPNDLKYDWEALREEMKEYGVRTYPGLAQMPVETSSTVLGEGSVNGIEPAHAKIITKGNKDQITKMVVPGLKKYGSKYEYRWNIRDNKGMLAICAILQKFMDQAISVNTNYNPEHYPDGKIPADVMLEDLVYFYKYGGKNLYYNNIKDGAGEEEVKEEEEVCDACTL
jgi:ribonucleoside-diphosphate reductase alpha chain